MHNHNPYCITPASDEGLTWLRFCRKSRSLAWLGAAAVGLVALSSMAFAMSRMCGKLGLGGYAIGVLVMHTISVVSWGWDEGCSGYRFCCYVHATWLGLGLGLGNRLCCYVHAIWRMLASVLCVGHEIIAGEGARSLLDRC